MNLFRESLSFSPQMDIPPLDRKVILITGATSGLGKQCALEYARHRPAAIWIAARNVEKALDAAQDIQEQLSLQATIKTLELDLTSLESVQKAAMTFRAQSDRLDILMLNAGIMAVPPGTTKDGFEIQFGTNYLGHVLLAKLLLPTLHQTALYPGSDVRIIMVSSHGHIYAPVPEGVLFKSLKSTASDIGPYTRYGQSKLAMILWVRQMAIFNPQLTTIAIHPGVVRTNLMNNAKDSHWTIRALGKALNRIVTPIDKGAKNQLWASVADGAQSGQYYEPIGIAGTATKLGRDDDLAKRLWDWTDQELRAYC